MNMMRYAFFQCWTNCYVLVAQGRCPYRSKMSKTACVSILSLFSLSTVNITKVTLEEKDRFRPGAFIVLQYDASNYILRCTAPHCFALQCIVFHCIAWHFNALHCIALHYIALHCIALHCIALHCIALHCIEMHYIALHRIALHCIALHCIVLHCHCILSLSWWSPRTG